MPLIQNLPAGKLDIVGDVHGDFEALQNLLHYLGYSPEGRHPQGRKLVFVGDLVDRGPDAPAVLAWFERAHGEGWAQMVLGNHEMNLLADEPKDGSGWFFDCRAAKDAANYAPWQRLPDRRKAAVRRFLQSQPLILERSDLRVVHAAWLPDAVAAVRGRAGDDIVALYQEWDEQVQRCIRHAPWFDDYVDEQRRYAHDLEEPSRTPPQLAASAEHDVYRSRSHPIRALTCGVEYRADAPFFASGRWRFSLRGAWWDDYADAVPVVIGHYWRQWHAPLAGARQRQLFHMPAHHWHGARGNVFCCDFSVGARWRDRKKGIAPSASAFRLAALRFPEKTLVFDNGETVSSVFGRVA
ncbi:metallophosphoesterase [Conchiformibius kuhniae]|uniref:Metallophosphoesterase n=1 Tax=Conchiformibius kuhniae TaxID=211502 RepID=A0ABD8B8J1_9NEIS|nr:metallophosphoesterase [Conchiformibius kuhniae]